MTKRPPNCSTWRYATLLRNGPTSRCWIGPRRLTASAFSTRAACRPTNRVGVDRRRVETKMGYGNRGKTNYVFPPFPQPRLPIEKLHSAVYTKYLTPPHSDQFGLNLNQTGLQRHLFDAHPDQFGL